VCPILHVIRSGRKYGARTALGVRTPSADAGLADWVGVPRVLCAAGPRSQIAAITRPYLILR
jgi:hypothetical protein